MSKPNGHNLEFTMDCVNGVQAEFVRRVIHWITGGGIQPNDVLLITMDENGKLRHIFQPAVKGEPIEEVFYITCYRLFPTKWEDESIRDEK